MKITMISVHSSGQPRMKMMNCASSMNCTGVRSIDSTQWLMISWPPSSANAAEKIDEPTNSQQTIALVFAVRNDGLLEDVPELARACAPSATPRYRAAPRARAR